MKIWVSCFPWGNQIWQLQPLAPVWRWWRGGCLISRAVWRPLRSPPPPPSYSTCVSRCISSSAPALSCAPPVFGVNLPINTWLKLRQTFRLPIVFSLCLRSSEGSRFWARKHTGWAGLPGLLARVTGEPQTRSLLNTQPQCAGRCPRRHRFPTTFPQEASLTLVARATPPGAGICGPLCCPRALPWAPVSASCFCQNADR